MATHRRVPRFHWFSKNANPVCLYFPRFGDGRRDRIPKRRTAHRHTCQHVHSRCFCPDIHERQTTHRRWYHQQLPGRCGTANGSRHCHRGGRTGSDEKCRRTSKQYLRTTQPTHRLAKKRPLGTKYRAFGRLYQGRCKRIQHSQFQHNSHRLPDGTWSTGRPLTDRHLTGHRRSFLSRRFHREPSHSSFLLYAPPGKYRSALCRKLENPDRRCAQKFHQSGT